MIQLTRQATAEVGPAGVRVNCLVPHTIGTPRLVERAGEERLWKIAGAVPLGRS